MAYQLLLGGFLCSFCLDDHMLDILHVVGDIAGREDDGRAVKGNISLGEAAVDDKESVLSCTFFSMALLKVRRTVGARGVDDIDIIVAGL